MKIITFQHKDILKEIKKSGIYLAKRDSFYRQNTPKCYDIVFNSIRNKEANSTQPIFAWYSVFKDEEICINNKTIKRCMELTGLDEDNYYLFELNIEEDKVSKQDFYNFVDARCEEEGFDAYYDSFEEFPIDSIFEIINCEIQCTISSIRKEYIENIYCYKKVGDEYEISSCNISLT